MAVLQLVVILLVLSTMSTGSTGKSPFKEECVSGRYPPPPSTKVPSYVVDLDQPPETRWHEVVKGKGKQIANLLFKFKDFLRKFGNHTQVIIDLVDNGVGYLADTFPSPYDDEIKGIAKSTGLPLGEVVLYNIFYEVFTVCTSIVAQDTSGKLYHARNLDFGLFMGWDIKNHTWSITEALRPMIVSLDFRKNGKTLYKSVNFAGYVGILTAMKPGTFTLTMNERFNLDGGYIGLIKWILGDRSGRWMGFLTRDVMEYSASYDDALRKLSTSPMLAPAYFILGGNVSNQASVITRSRAGAVDTWQLGKEGAQWYLLETNYDHWEKAFILDDRRTPANNCMRNKTQKAVSFSGLYDVLSSKPVLNKLTTYTALMQVNTGRLEVYLRDCPDPCFPW